jgi:hypothetical protein
LTLAGVQTNNAGSYVVVVSNPYGSTNSRAASLAVAAAQNIGDVIFANNNNTATKIFTNSAVGGPPTGLTAANAGLYCYALYASATATTVNGQSSAICGAASLNYAFNDPNWTLVAYGTNLPNRGRLVSASVDAYGLTPVPGFAPGAAAQFVVIGWSINIGTDIPSVQNWFGLGDPAIDGWIGQSAVSGPLPVGGGILPGTVLFGGAPGMLNGFTLGLASPDPAAAYALPYAIPAILQTKLSGGGLELSWPTAAGSFGVQSAAAPAGPWTDTGLTVTTLGTNSTVIVPAGYQGSFFRLVVE